MAYDNPEDIAAVRGVFQQYQDYYTARDGDNIDACMALFTADPEVEVIGTGAITHGTDEWCDGPELVRQLTEGDWEGWGDVRFDVEGAHIHAYGDLAWLATTATVTTTYPAEDNLRQAVERSRLALGAPGDDEGRLREMLMWATTALHEAGRGEVYIWPIRFTAVLVREAGAWRFHQAHFSFPTTRFPDERWTILPQPRRPPDRCHRGIALMSDQAKPYASVIDVIGKTPVVELSRLTARLTGRLLAKLEYLNPGFSKKDRIARQIIEEAEAAGQIKPGDTVVELTSGNTGTGLAIVCGVKGYHFVAVMSKGNSTERARMMRAMGAEVVLVDQLPDSTPGQVSGGDLALVEEAAQRITRERDAFRADQFHLEGNFRAHYLHTGPDFWQQSGESIEAFCDFPGTGGSFAGCSAAFKERDPSIACYVVEPAGAAVLAGQPVTNPSHRIQGGGYSMPDLPLLPEHLVDEFLQVSDEEAMAAARRLAAEEGIFAGFSSGANVAAALRLLEGDQRGRTVGVLINDSGLKYLSTDLWP